MQSQSSLQQKPRRGWKPIILLRLLLALLGIAFYSFFAFFVIIFVIMAYIINMVASFIQHPDFTRKDARRWTKRISWAWIDGFVECWKFFRDGGDQQVFSTFFSHVSLPLIAFCGMLWDAMTFRE
jgi:hypothetical protein